VLDVNRHKINKLHKTFGDASPGVPFVFLGSSGYLEIGVNQESAAKALSVNPGDRVTLFSSEALQSW
jgi:S-adenosylmethionine hydrolase